MTAVRRRKAATGAGIGCALSVVVAFCLTLGVIPVPTPSFGGIEDLPLPGGADLGPHPYTITADMKDVLSLVPRSAVKVNDVAVGRVTDIRLAGDGSWAARVTLRINGDVELPAGTSARLEQSSLLGEKYVQLVAPRNGTGSLRAGDRIPCHAPAATPRSRRSSAPCRCSSTAAASTSSRRSPPSSTRRSADGNRKSARRCAASTPLSRTSTTTAATSPRRSTASTSCRRHSRTARRMSGPC